jgi:hypothetical protein
MPASKYKLTIEQGSTFDLNMRYLWDDQTPIDLYDYTARMQIRSNYADFNGKVWLSISGIPDASGSFISIAPETGNINVHISPLSSQSFNFDDGYYDIELVSGSFVERLLEGQVINKREVTR